MPRAVGTASTRRATSSGSSMGMVMPQSVRPAAPHGIEPLGTADPLLRAAVDQAVVTDWSRIGHETAPYGPITGTHRDLRLSSSEAIERHRRERPDTDMTMLRTLW
jgi:hypothetical protein